MTHTQRLVTDLLNSGMTQKKLGQEIGITQPVISDIRSGKVKDVSFCAGLKLLRCYQLRFPDRKIDIGELVPPAN